MSQNRMVRSSTKCTGKTPEEIHNSTLHNEAEFSDRRFRFVKFDSIALFVVQTEQRISIDS